MLSRKIDSRDYYDFFPPNIHRAGDIWRGLPTYGTLGGKTCTGIVITPACDLAQQKCETITYIPVVPIEEYLSSSAFYFEIWTEVSSAIQALKLETYIAVPRRHALPSFEELEKAISTVPEALKKVADSSARDRLRRYSDFVGRARSRKVSTVSELSGVFRKRRYTDLLRGIVMNSYKIDIHFLPFDTKPKHISAVPQHSLALFRYPLTLPITLLNIAQRCTSDAWEYEISHNTEIQPLASHFDERPIRMATLKPAFLADMISRYIAMYVRLGLPDFTNETVAAYIAQLEQ